MNVSVALADRTDHVGSLGVDGRHPFRVAQGGISPARAVQTRQVHRTHPGVLDRAPRDLVALHRGGQVLEQQDELAPVLADARVQHGRCTDGQSVSQVAIELHLGPVDAGDHGPLRGIGARELGDDRRGCTVGVAGEGHLATDARAHLSGADLRVYDVGHRGVVTRCAQREREPLRRQVFGQIDDGDRGRSGWTGRVGRGGVAHRGLRPGLASWSSKRPAGRRLR